MPRTADDCARPETQPELAAATPRFTAPSRRTLLTGGLFAALGVTALAAADPAGADPVPGNGGSVSDVITPEQFGCIGDGSTDNAGPMQDALDALTPGQTLRFAQGGVYNTSATWTVSTDNVTIDVNRATVRAHSTRNGNGGNGLTGDNYIALDGVRGVQLIDGVLGTPQSPASSGGDQIAMVNCTECIVSGWTIGADVYTVGSTAIMDRIGTNNAIRGNHVTGGGIGQVGGTYTVLENNIIDSAPDQDAIASFGYTDYPSRNTIIRWNLIRNYGRIGIEDYSPDNDRTLILETKIYGNRIDTYAGNGDAGQGISAMGASAVIHDNEIVDAAAWAIEASADGVAVNHNKVIWSTLAGGSGNTGIVFSSTSISSGRVINQCIGNEIHQAEVGIEAYQDSGNGLTSPISVVGNNVSEARRIGIDVSNSGGSTVTGNVVQWLAPGPSGQTRTGIQSGPQSRNVGNTIVLGANSGQAGVPDTPWVYTAPSASYVSNVVNASNRSTGAVISGAFGQPGDGSRFVDDRHVNGATRTLASMTNVVGDALPGVAAQTLSSNGPLTLDASSADTQTVTLKANCTAMTINNGVVGQRLRIVLVQDSAGKRTTKWPASVKFAGGAAPALCAVATKRDSVVVELDANGYWYEVSRALKM